MCEKKDKFFAKKNAFVRNYDYCCHDWFFFACGLLNQICNPRKIQDEACEMSH